MKDVRRRSVPKMRALNRGAALSTSAFCLNLGRTKEQIPPSHVFAKAYILSSPVLLKGKIVSCPPLVKGGWGDL